MQTPIDNLEPCSTVLGRRASAVPSGNDSGRVFDCRQGGFMGQYRGQGQKHFVRIDCKEWVAGPGYGILSIEDKGYFTHLMCMLIQCKQPGIFRKSKKDLLRLCNSKHLRLERLIEKKMIVGSDERMTIPVQYENHKGEWITLVLPQDGPIWIIPKLVIDEHQRQLSAKWMVSDANSSRRDKRLRVLEKTGGKCYHCDAILNPAGGWHIDHLIPSSRGGSDEMDNLFPACPPCNNDKGDSMPGEWTPPKYRKAAGVMNG